ncbi:hypothetical protein L1049_020558 [Liquidambar formosana]|uniref:F-box domain-containing protein n=1 Tax=Liquidambar formosana TaxID=63359 RepID=A0AAP0X441_LIQFO
MTHMSEPLPAADEITSNDDLLTEILRRLPLKSLLKFKSVSKPWLSLICNPHFSRRRNPNSISGLFLQRYTPDGCFVDPKFDFVPLDDCKPELAPFRSLPFVDGRSGIRLVHSCNGLLCCFTLGVNVFDRRYYIYNPTTRQYTQLHNIRNCDRPQSAVMGVNLAFDPSKSPHYKVVCVLGFEDGGDYSINSDCQIKIYSSETRLWKISGGVFSANRNIDFNQGVFWNGALHWICCYHGPSLCFDVDQERLREIPMPPIPEFFQSEIRYFGESRDHLHIVAIRGPRLKKFDVYEMRRDYSEWFVKYHVDLDSLTTSLPEMVVQSFINPPHYYEFGILCLLRGETDEESYLVLHVPGKAIRYNLKDQSYEKLCDVEDIDYDDRPRYRHSNAYRYVECLSWF